MTDTPDVVGSDVSSLDRIQFAAAVAAAISGVHHLYREVDRLIASLQESIGKAPDSLAIVRATLRKSDADRDRLVIRHDYGLLFTPAEEEDEPEDLGDDVEDEEAEVDASEGRKKRNPLELSSDQPLLAVRIALYDPRHRDDFEPSVRFAVLSEWATGSQPSAGGQRYSIARYMLRRVPRVLEADTVAKGDRVTTDAVVAKVKGSKKSDGRRLSCRLPSGVQGVSLFALDSAAALDEIAERMKASWREFGA
jgi:hypothetical protein